MVAQIRERDREIAAAIASGKAKLGAEIRARAAAFKDAWAALSQKVLDAFDETTQEMVSKLQDTPTPTEALIARLTDAHEQAALQDAVDQAKKNLADAMAGVTSSADSSMMDAVRGIVGRFSLANALDKLQSAILGGPAGSGLLDPLLQQLQAALKPGAQTADPQAVLDAQKALDEALYNQRLYNLGKVATAERAAVDAQVAALEKERAAERKILEDKLADWGDYFAKLGHKAAQAAADIARILATITGAAGPPTGGGTGTAGGTGGGGGTFIPDQGVTNILGPSTSTSGGTATTTSSSGTRSLTGVNSTATTSFINDATTFGNFATNSTSNLPAGTQTVVFPDTDPNLAADVAAAQKAGLKVSINVADYGGETPTDFAARMAAASRFPGVIAIADIEAHQDDPTWNAQAAGSFAQTSPGTPYSLTTAQSKPVVYGAWKNPQQTFIQTYQGNMTSAGNPATILATAQAQGAVNAIPLLAPGQTYSAGPSAVYQPAPNAPTITTTSPTTTTTTTSTPTATYVPPIITNSIGTSFSSLGTIGMFAEGGVVPGPQGSPQLAIVHGGEVITPSGNRVGGDGVTVHLNFANGMEWLSQFVEARVVGAAGRVALHVGKTADTRRREGRF